MNISDVLSAYAEYKVFAVADANSMVDCPRCGGMPDLDEDGRPYTCFFCCNTGSVPKYFCEDY
jgi:hypothetical protein